MLLPAATVPVSAATGERTLYLHHTHTGETGRFTFKRDGQYDQNVLHQLNVFLADWRTKQPTKMDPALFDLIWTIYREVGATQPINIVSSYRAPATNAMLRAKSSGVAENSQHMKGKAMDIFIPGVPISKLRQVAMRHQVGGVGYYPTSGSPFVHVDTGSVRAWPRMTRAQLEKVFPDGRTLHVPVDGKPLSSDGRRYAEAQWQKCHMVPCNGAPSVLPAMPEDGGNDAIMVASNQAPVPATPSPNLFSAIFGGVASIPDAEPAQRLVATVAVAALTPAAPVPMLRRGSAVAELAQPGDPAAPVPASKSPAIRLATGPTIQANDGETAVVALAHLGAPIPAPRVLMTPKEDLMVTAYVPAMQPDPGAQRALQILMERETTASIPPKPTQKPAPSQVHMASLGASPTGIDALANLFQATWNAVSGLGQPPLAAALRAHVTPPPNPAFGVHAVELTAPDIDHVAETMVQPVAMSDVFFGEFYEPEGYLDKTTELGPMATRIGFDPDPTIAGYDRFVAGAPLLVATR